MVSKPSVKVIELVNAFSVKLWICGHDIFFVCQKIWIATFADAGNILKNKCEGGRLQRQSVVIVKESQKMNVVFELVRMKGIFICLLLVQVLNIYVMQ